MMKKYALITSLIFLSGCASVAVPNFIDGQYYMSGDDSCVSYNKVSDTRIGCLDKDGEETGYRDAMTSQEITMWSQQQALAEIRSQAILQSINQNNQALNQQTQQALQNIGQINTPQVNSFLPSSGTTYTQVGTSVVGSNGVTYQQVGNSFIGSDGTTCQIIGSNTICN